jgi:hypothetical protein
MRIERSVGEVKPLIFRKCLEELAHWVEGAVTGGPLDVLPKPVAFRHGRAVLPGSEDER